MRISMKFFRFFLFLPIFFLFSPPILAQTNEVNIYFFYGDGCPHCVAEEALLNKVEFENKNATVHRYEVWRNSKNADFLSELGGKFNWDMRGVPFTIVGEKTFIGYLSENTTGAQIKNAADECSAYGCRDLVGEYLQDKKTAVADLKQEKVSDKIQLPIFGEIDAKKISLPILTFVIAALDGFNPCALWILLFLIGLLVGMREKKKMLILGSAFIISSAVFYFFVLAAWFNIISLIGLVFWLRFAIGLVAIYAGYYNLKRYFSGRNSTCEVVDESKRKKLFNRIKDIVAREKILLAVIGVIMLAVSVNFIELVCSAGFPAVYSQILALAELPRWQYYAYLSFYSLIFVLNQIIIFLFAFFTFKMKALNPQITRWIYLIGGAIMVIIGILLLFKPTWLMFG